MFPLRNLWDINISKQRCVFYNKISDLKIQKKTISWYIIFFHNLIESHEGRTITNATQGRNSLSCPTFYNCVQGPWEKIRVISNQGENRCKPWSAFHMPCDPSCSNRINCNRIAATLFIHFTSSIKSWFFRGQLDRDLSISSQIEEASFLIQGLNL